jgi:hypothetical protein
MSTAATGLPPRICVCVLLNHPFPANLPLLREIYAGRFSEVRFLIPFVRLPDPDVITVYRGSYVHAAYLADAYHVLKDIDCDHFIVVQDDVLLNPQLSEKTFRQIYAIGPRDGFIPVVDPMQGRIEHNSWTFGLIARWLNPKSLMLGSGIEAETLKNHLPSRETMEQAFARSGQAATDAIHITPDNTVGMRTFGSESSRLVLHGLTGPVDDEWCRDSIETHCEAIVNHFLGAMRDARRTAQADASLDEANAITLPIPTVDGHYYTDFYILPASAIHDFAHYMGVAGAANLFVEVIAPTILHACCDRVWTGEELGLDFSGFADLRPLRWFEDIRHSAIHPIKLSAFRDPERYERLVSTLRALGAGESERSDSGFYHAAFGRWEAGFVGRGEGWHGGEPWGVWSSAPEAVIPVSSSATRVWLQIRPALPSYASRVVGRVTHGSTVVEIVTNDDGADNFIEFELDPADSPSPRQILLHNDYMRKPSDIDPANEDHRPLGCGLVRVVFS